MNPHRSGRNSRAGSPDDGLDFARGLFLALTVEAVLVAVVIVALVVLL